jgi:chaperonin GroEL
MDRGFVSSYMVTDPARMEAVYDKPAIVITDRKISSIQEFLPLLEKLAQAGKKDLVIIAEDIEGEALATLVLNRLKGVLNTVAVKAPAFGDRRSDILNDIAVLTGGDVIAEDRGMTFENVDLDVVGTARKIIVTKDDTTIIEGGGKSSAVKTRIAQINEQTKQATSEYDRENLEKRRAALEGKVAVIKVGGVTETEIEEKKFRVDDAVAAVKAAMDEGIVPGGGVTLLNLGVDLVVKRQTAKDKKNIQAPESMLTGDPGADILIRALHQPFDILLKNAGFTPETYIAKINKPGLGVNVMTGEIVNMLVAGIVDPTRVTKEAILNAVSIAGTAMTMGALVADIPEKSTPAGGAAPDMGGIMGM